MKLRVYYEDTDAGGVVYHGRYAGFFERGRTEYFRDRGFPVGELHLKGVIFPVVRMELDFIAPARFDDLVRVETELAKVGNSSMVMEQRLLLDADSKLLANAKVVLVCVDSRMKPKRIPKELREIATNG